MKSFKEQYPDYQENWTYYFTSFSDERASVALDLNLLEKVPVNGYQWRCVLMVRLEDSIRGHYQELDDMDDAAAAYLSESIDAVRVGRITFEDQLHYIYYLNQDTNPKAGLKGVLDKWKVEWEVELVAEPDWQTYLQVLYPDHYEESQIHNREIYEQLKEQGDDGSERRPVTHWSYFETPADRKQFMKLVLASGYEIGEELDADEKTEDGQVNEVRYGLMYWRSQTIDPEEMDASCARLIRQSEENNGYYDGWETEVKGK